MTDDRRSAERNSLMLGAEPELLVQYTDPVTQAVGYAVIDTLATGVAFGGLRIAPGLKWTNLAPLARIGTIRYQLARVPLGGARLGLAVDPAAPDVDEILGRFLTTLEPLLASSLSIGPDAGSTAELIDHVLSTQNLPWRMSAVQQHQGWQVDRWHRYQTVIDEKVGGTVSRDEQVPRGVAAAVVAMAEFLFHRKPTVAVIGRGPFGFEIARTLARMGATVVATGGASAGVYSQQGLRSEVLDSGVNFRMTLDPSVTYLTRGELYALPVDVLVLAAAADAVTVDNVGMLQSSLIVEAAARAVSRDAEKVLNARRIPVLPSFAATMGAVFVVDGFLRGEIQDRDGAFAHAEAQIRKTILEIARLSSTLHISLREAGMRLAFHRWDLAPPSTGRFEPHGHVETEDEPPEVL